MSKIVYFGEYK